MLPPVDSELLNDAVNALNGGDFARAHGLAADLRTHSPSPQALYVELMAMVGQGMLRGTQRLLKANEAYLAQWPDGVAMAAHVQGRLAMRQGKPEVAVPLFRSACRLLDKNPSCFMDYAEALFLTAQFAEAHAVYLQVLQMGEVKPEVYGNLAACAMRMQQFDAAFAYQYVGWKNAPNGAMARQLGDVFLLSGNMPQALAHFAQAERLGERSAECYRGMGDAYRRLRYYRRAIRCFEKALAVAAPSQEVMLLKDLVHCHERAGSSRDAQRYIERLMVLDPNNLIHWLHRGNIAQIDGDYAGALVWGDQAEAKAPGLADVQYYRGFIQLLQGNWLEGYRNYETRWDTVAFKEKYGAVVKPIDSPRWDGVASLEGKLVMAMCEQGAGDIIQYSLYIPELIARGATVDLLVPPFMTEVARTMPWVRQVHDNYFQIPPHDYYVSLMSMPLHMGTEVETVPVATTPFLHAPRKRPRFSDKFTVALSWAGDHKHNNDAWRSMPTHVLYDLIAAFPQVQFVSLQLAPHDRVTMHYLKAGLLLDGMANARSFTDTAAAMDAVDLVISVDTATAHLAAAMHKPIWMLLSAYADWRWVGGETTTRWYPTVRLFRQKSMHGWRELLLEVAEALRPMVGGVVKKKSWKKNA